LFFHHWLETHDTRGALSLTISSVHAVVKATLDSGSRELSLIAAQDEFTNPSQLFAAEAV
jgi:pyridoxine kinase